MLCSTSFWQLLRRRWCQTVMAPSFLWIHHRRGGGSMRGRGGEGGGGGRTARAKAFPPHCTAQDYIQTTLSPTPTSTPGEDTPASQSTSAQHGEQQIPVTGHLSIGIERGAKGCHRRRERSSDLTGQLSPTSSWGPCQ